MKVIYKSSPLRVEKYRTREGEEFTVRRRARPGRKFQKPTETGEELTCPFCGDTHRVLEYTMREGREGERKIKSWKCPVAGGLSLNLSEKFQKYINSIITQRRVVRESVSASPEGEDEQWEIDDDLLKKLKGLGLVE